MSERHPSSDLNEALQLLGQTYQRAHAVSVERHAAQRTAQGGLKRLFRIAGASLIDQRMHGVLGDTEISREVVQEAVQVGMEWYRAQALESGVTNHLPKVLQEADMAIASLIGTRLLHAQTVQGLQPHAGIMLKTPTSTQSYPIPEEGVIGALVDVDSRYGRLYLAHPETKHSWEITVFNDPETLELKANVHVAPNAQHE